mgnify:CR=1 FL=1
MKKRPRSGSFLQAGSEQAAVFGQHLVQPRGQLREAENNYWRQGQLLREGFEVLCHVVSLSGLALLSSVVHNAVRKTPA